MKKIALLLSFVFAAGVAGAQETKTTTPNPDKAAAMASEKATHQVKAEVVSFDAMKSTLTIKGDKENKTVPVEGKAVAALKDVKPGTKLTLVCKDDAAGTHQAVVDVKPSAN